MTDEQLLAAINSAVQAVQTNLKAEMAAMKEDLLEHIHGVGAQLHTEIQEVVDRMDARLDRHGGLLQGGSRAITRMIADPNPYDGLKRGQIDLWASDHYHASTMGYYLEALTIFAAVTHIDPRALGRNERRWRGRR